MKKAADKGITIFLWMAAILVNIKAIFTDFEVDSAYALSTSWRHIHGDRLFMQMWEPHQSSSFVMDFLMLIYQKIVPSMDGVALYLQIAGVLLYVGVTVLLYRELGRHIDARKAGIISIFFFTVRAKNLVVPEFSNMLIAFSTLLFVELLKLKRTHGYWAHAVMTGFFLGLCVLSYPTMVLAVFPVVGWILVSTEKKRASVLGVALTCLVMGGLYLALIGRGIGVKQLWENFGYIFSSDSTHQTGFLNIQNQWITGLKQDIYYLFPGMIIVGGVSARSLSKQEKDVWAAGTLLSLTTFVAVFLLTNQGIASVCQYLILGCAVSWIPMDGIAAEKGKVFKIPFSGLISIAACMIFLLARGIWIYGYSAEKNDTYIWQMENIIRSGPTRGIVASTEICDRTGIGLMEWRENVHSGDEVLAVSGWLIDSSVYLYTDAGVANYSTIDTTTYNERLLLYWELHPEKKPTVIAIQGYMGNQEISPGSWISRWVSENYEKVYEGIWWSFYR